MCIICISEAGIPQPTVNTLRQMFDSNPHGAGYMVARKGHVEISKGFMTWGEFKHAIDYEKFTPDDAVVYHFRISTQAGINAPMTHPFPLTRNIHKTKMIDVSCPIGVAHNGIIRLTSDPRDKEFSDTAHFIAEYLAYLVRTPDDLHNAAILDAIENLTHSKFALMDKTGYIATVGDFITEDDGIMYSNSSYLPRHEFSFNNSYGKKYKMVRSIFEDAPYAW